MKKFSLIIMALFLAIGFTSCSDSDDLNLTVQPDPEGLNFTSTISSEYILTNDTRSNLAERFVWNEVDLGLPTDITYEVQGASTLEFTDMKVLGSTNETNAGVTVDQFLQLATAAGLDNDPETTITDTEGNTVANNSGIIFIRLHAFAGNGNANSVEQFSDVQELNVFLPENVGAEEMPAMLYVVGSFLDDAQYGAEWTAGDAVALAASSANTTDFQGYVSIPNADSQFKFLPTLGTFDGDYGDTGATDGTYSETIIQDGEVNCGTPDNEGGYFLVNVDTSELTYSLRPQVWGIIGAATPTGWDNDTNLTYNPEDKTWTIDLDLIPGAFKFRANDNWDDNVDNLGAGDEQGMLSFSGDDLNFEGEAGNYHVVLDLSNPRAYTYTITAN
ncbi:MAG TPA: SusF/SusE family outer membrane protein [Leeuwenhoekiella sp.]|nr:SusF/SusE family outer membrane protein [Leeuwenhoekiella sp.]